MAYVVKNTTTAVHSIHLKSGIIVLKPGNNEVSEKEWEEMKKNAKVDERVTNGKYVMIAPDVTTKEAKKKEEDSGASESLSGYSVNKAKTLVKEVYDLELLERWETEESRSKVLSAIKAQIKEVKSK